MKHLIRRWLGIEDINSEIILEIKNNRLIGTPHDIDERIDKLEFKIDNKQKFNIGDDVLDYVVIDCCVSYRCVPIELSDCVQRTGYSYLYSVFNKKNNTTQHLYEYEIINKMEGKCQ